MAGLRSTAPPARCSCPGHRPGLRSAVVLALVWYSDKAGCGSVPSGREVTSRLTPGVWEFVPRLFCPKKFFGGGGAGDWGSPSQEVAKLPDPSKLALW